MEESEIVDKIKERLLPSFDPYLTQADPQNLVDLLRHCTLIEEGNKKRDNNSNKTNAIYDQQRGNRNNITCQNCDKIGHIAKYCRAPRRYEQNWGNSHNNRGQGIDRNGGRNRGQSGGKPNTLQRRKEGENNNYRSNNPKATSASNNNNFSYNNNNNRSYSNNNNGSYNTSNNGSYNNNTNSGYNNNNGHRGRRRYQNQSRNNDTTNNTANVIAYVAPERPFLKKIYVSGKPVMALIDTGASASMMKKSKAAELELTLTPPSMTMGVANGTSMGNLDETTARITLDTNNMQHNFLHEFTVAAELPFDAIIGKDVLRKRNIFAGGANDELITNAVVGEEKEFP